MKIRCRLFGHQFFWLDYQHQCHCRLCGQRDDAHFERQERLDEILRVAHRVNQRMDNAARPPHPLTQIGRQ